MALPVSTTRPTPPAHARSMAASDAEMARRLRQSRVLLVGVGGLGSPAALSLAASGVGSLVLVDFDRVDESNLQRQVLFDTADLGRSKVDAGRAQLLRMAPGGDVDVIGGPLSVAHAARLRAGRRLGR